MLTIPVRASFAAVIALGGAACARPEPPRAAFAPVVTVTPPGVSSRLAVDSTVAVALTPDALALIGAGAGGCAAALRDPASGVRYLLHEAQSVTTQYDARPAGAAPTVEEQAHYLPVEGQSLRLPEGHYLRVACRTNRVLGLATALEAGT